MRWVTWENIGVDRMACIWLIRRWIDAEAEFIFVPAESKSLPKGFEPFDIPGMRFSHHGNHCTFYALLKTYDPKDPILIHIANIIDEADLVQEINVEPAAVGLDMICRGLRQISKDDFEAMERGSLIYDALYAQLKLESPQ